MRIRSLVAAVALCAVVLPVAACGSNDPSSDSPNDLASKTAVDAFRAGAEATVTATDVVAAGSLPIDKVPSQVESAYSGKDGKAKVTSKKATYQVVRIDRTLYVSGNQAFWITLVGREQALKIGDNWVRSPVDGPLSAFNFFVDRNSFFRASVNVTKGEVTTVDGQPTLPIIDPKTNTDSTWWFRTTGEPVLLKYTSAGTWTFGFSYEEVVVIEAPPAAQTIDIAQVEVPASKIAPDSSDS